MSAFSADTDLARIAEDTPFAFTVDWGLVNWTQTVVPLRHVDEDTESREIRSHG